jgi:hypothetical protein
VVAKALAEVEDSLVDCFFACVFRDPAVCEEVLFEDDEFLGADFQSFEETSLVFSSWVGGLLLTLVLVVGRRRVCHRGRLDACLWFGEDIGEYEAGAARRGSFIPCKSARGTPFLSVHRALSHVPPNDAHEFSGLARSRAG